MWGRGTVKAAEFLKEGLKGIQVESRFAGIGRFTGRELSFLGVDGRLSADVIENIVSDGARSQSALYDMGKLGFYSDKGLLKVTPSGTIAFEDKGVALFMRDKLHTLDGELLGRLEKDGLIRKSASGSYEVNYGKYSKDELAVTFHEDIINGHLDRVPKDVKDMLTGNYIRGGSTEFIENQVREMLRESGEKGREFLLKAQPGAAEKAGEALRSGEASQGASQGAAGAAQGGTMFKNGSTWGVTKDVGHGIGHGLNAGTNTLLKNWKGLAGLGGTYLGINYIGVPVYNWFGKHLDANEGLGVNAYNLLVGNPDAENRGQGQDGQQQQAGGGQSYIVGAGGRIYEVAPDGQPKAFNAGGFDQGSNHGGGQQNNNGRQNNGGGPKQNNNGGGNQSFLGMLMDKLGLGKIGDFFSGNGVFPNITGLAGMAAAAYLIFSRGGWMSKIFGGLMAFLAFQSMTGGSSEQQEQQQYLAEGLYEEEMENQDYVPEVRRSSAPTYTI